MKKLVNGKIVTMSAAEAADFAPAPPAPRTTLRAYLMIALDEAGKLAAVEAAVTAQGGAALLLWREAATFSEADPEIIALATALQINRKAIWDRCDEIAEARRLARAG
jgi:hypothetical protein